MNKDIIEQVLQEILQKNPNYFLPKTFHVLTWKSKKTEGALITKINGQRYLGLPRQDRIGQGYWCYKPLPTEPEQSNSETQFAEQPSQKSVSQPTSDSITKYQQRLAKTRQINHGKSEPAVNQQSQSNS